MRINKNLSICVLALLFSMISSPTIAFERSWGHHHSALPKCADLATNPAYGLAGNPVVISPTSVPVAATVPPATVHAAYCQVDFTYSSESGPEDGYDIGQSQHIKIRIGLPLNSVDGGTGSVQGAWNGKLQNLGGGGCVGNVGNVFGATDAGYVGTSTDTGHTAAENQSSLCAFGVIQSTNELNLGLIEDFIYEGVHQQVEWGKKVAKTYYGMAVKRNYWNGCSTGGRQGLALAQKWGDEFDGFIIGAPAIYWQEFRLADAWPPLVNKDMLDAAHKLTPGQVAAANAAAIAACDVLGLDSVPDGIIGDTRQCQFSATANICGVEGAPAAPNCLSPEQAYAIDMIWDGPRNKYGKRIWYPFDRGINFGVGSLPGSTRQVMAYNHRDLTFDVNNLYINDDAIAAAGYPANAISYEDEATLGSRETGDYMETQDVTLDEVKKGYPDHHRFGRSHERIPWHHLDKVKKRGAKIIMWHGMQDGAIRWRHSLNYYRRVATYFGHGKADFAALQSWFRYYPAPGVSHCGGGVGPSPVNIFDVLVNWVENGVDPDTILARGGSGNPTRERPLCLFPTTAIYDGVGDPNVASSFRCGGNLETPAMVCNDDVRTFYKHENETYLDYWSIGALECLKPEWRPRWWAHGPEYCRD